MIYYLNKDVVSTPSLNCSNQYGCGRWDSWGNCQQSGWWYNCSEPYVPPVQNCSWQYVCNVFSWNSSCLSQEWQYVCNGNYSNCSEQCYSWDYWGNCNSSSWYGNCNFTNNSCADTKICTGYSWNGTCDSFYYEWNCQDKQNSWTDSYCYDQNVCVDNFNGECRRYEYVRNCSNTTYYFRCLQANYSQCSLYEREFNTTYNDPLDCNSSYGCGNWSSDGSCMSWGYWTNCSFPAPPQDCHWEWLCSAFSWNGSCVNYTQEYICNGQYPNCTWREQCFSWDYWGNCNSSSWYQDCNHNVTNDTCAWVEECSLSQWGSCVNYTRYWDCSSKDSWSDYHCYDDYQCLSEFAQSCRQWGYQTNCTNTTIDYSCIQWNNNNTCGVYARINTTTYTLPLNCSMDWGCGVWNWEGSCAQYGYWRNCSLPGPTQNCTWEDVCVSYYSNGTCYGYRQEYICNGNYTNCTQNQTCVQYD